MKTLSKNKILPPNDRFHVSFIDGGPVETLNTILAGKSKIPKMMVEVENGANGKIPVLIFKFDRTKFYVASKNLPDEHTRILLGEIKIGMLDDVVQWINRPLPAIDNGFTSFTRGMPVVIS